MKETQPEYIFETSWEVCNKVGGIYTVLSTRANTLKSKISDKLFFIGPDLWKEREAIDFIPTKDFAEWVAYAKGAGLNVRVGRWDIPGQPYAILVDYKPFFAQKDKIYSSMWEWYGVDSLHAYGDYDDSSMFAYASGAVIESYTKFYKLTKKNIAAHFNEWTTGMGLLYCNKHLPTVATLFTTHATSIGRSIAGNHKPLYNYMTEYNGDHMAWELNMQSKHSIEKIAAHTADCFTTVSDITNVECRHLLEKPADIITPNGFEMDFVPNTRNFKKSREAAKSKLKEVSEALFGYELSDNVMYVATSGRYEFKNKGIDIYIESLRVAANKNPEKEIVAFILVPAWSNGVNGELKARLDGNEDVCVHNNYITHSLVEPWNDPASNSIKWFHLSNNKDEKVKVVFVPCYLDGRDGIFNMSYYDLLIGFDLTIFPSYYEPWGYTPLESVAFSIPTITTNLSGFGQWTNHSPQNIMEGVGIIERSDYNFHEVVEDCANMIVEYSKLKAAAETKVRKKALEIAKKALWSNFISNYYDAYALAFKNVAKRSI